jgi:PPOX class probable F420-dependent enzyme
MLDATTRAGAAAAARLETEITIWLTTVSPTGQPQSSPVWFLWADGEFLVRSLATTPRVRNIEANPRVSISLDTNGRGGGVVSVEGEARIDGKGLAAAATPALIAKYRSLLDEYGWSPERYAADYPTAIRIRPIRWRVG